MTLRLTRKRESGVLLHISSLPSEFGVGDMGSEAERWVDFLADAKQRYWQVLPLTRTSEDGYNSPYQPVSAFALNPLLISPVLLHEDGLLGREEVGNAPRFVSGRADYAGAARVKEILLKRAFRRFRKMREQDQDFREFCETHGRWLDDYCFFVSLNRHFPERSWRDWPAALRDHDETALQAVRTDLREEIDYQRFQQFIANRQWSRLKQYANAKGIRILGDIPFYVGLECADVWSQPALFKLDANRRPTCFAGVPPDRFSDTGQLWHSPVYEWLSHAGTDYAWWVDRLKHNLTLFDTVRIDHFRGFAAYWEVPSDQPTAIEGHWAEGPGGGVLDALSKVEREPSLVAEDLGHITDDVRELIDRYQLPSMKVLLFGFDEADSLHAPHNHTRNSVVYTGTHDNNTVCGWFKDEASEDEKLHLEDYVGHDVEASMVNWDMIRLAMMSSSQLAIVPAQDLLGLGSEARMNRPAIRERNWEWRLGPGQVNDDLAEKLAHVGATYGRN